MFYGPGDLVTRMGEWEIRSVSRTLPDNPGELAEMLYGLHIVYKKHFNVVNSIFCMFICRLFIGCITSAFVLAVVVFAITLYVLIMFFIDRDSLKSLTGKHLITLSCIFKIKLW